MASAIRMLSALIEEPSARTARWAMGGESQAPRAVLSDGGSSRASHRPPRRSRKATTSRRALGCYMHGGLAGRLAGASRWGLFLRFAPLGPSSHERTPRARGARLSPMIHARPPRWRLGDAPKRMPCAFLCSPVNPSLAFSMTRPEPLPWWARGTAPVRRGCTQVRPRRGGIAARAKTDGGQDMSIPAGWTSGCARSRARGRRCAVPSCKFDELCQRHPSVALALMALCALAVMTAESWWA